MWHWIPANTGHYSRPAIPPPYARYDMGNVSAPHRRDEYVPPIPPRNYAAPPPLPPRPGNEITNADPATAKNDMSNLFSAPLSTDAPLSEFKRVQHKVGLLSSVRKDDKPVPTNKFYANFLLDDQTLPVWTQPYSLWMDKDKSYVGMAVSQIRADQRVFDTHNKPPRFFFAPRGIRSVVFSATELTSSDGTSLQMRDLKHLSAQARLAKSDKEYIQFPLVQGMGFVTAIYYNLVPKLYSPVGFKSIDGQTSPRSGINKYRIQLQDNVTWTLYVTVPEGQSLTLALQNGAIVGDKGVNGCVFQIVPSTEDDIDRAAGCYPIDGSLSGSIDGSNGTYTLTYTTRGSSNGGTTLMYALPHHVEYATSKTTGKINSTLAATVLGNMQGYLTNVIEVKVPIPSGLSFDPYTTISGKQGPQYSDEVKQKIREAADKEVNNDVSSESDLDSMYYSGKILLKYAWVLYVCQYVLRDSDKVSKLMPKLKDALGRFISNKQQLPLYYDTTWNGIISSGSIYQDFGNPYYNDHHFHYGYHVAAAAILAKVDGDAGDGKWLGENKNWVENLIRDYANPHEDDKYFPVFRSFDWFTGHSWAKGVFESGDGKDQESSSEDVNAAYALKLWGQVTNNSNLAGIGDLMIGILRTSLNHYFLYLDDNKTMPEAFIKNKVSGILFDNKVDHATYFGAEPQYIHMIHAIPIIPASSFVRSPKFVREEWDQKLSSIVDGVQDGWKGLLMLNLALTDPRASYEFFSGSGFQDKYLDNGQSKTWSLAYSGAFL
ncbi:AaceriAGL161Cp [[Ashbya] aceris (nom. inval.)]|nr:AaceriAGL161Cp [[Ashbya] aceris (nom. inval.)]